MNWKERGLRKISKNGFIKILAIDHRGSLRRILKTPNYEQISEIKQKITKILSPHSSAVLLDPVYGKEAIKEVKGGLLISREKSGYVKNGGRKTELLENYTVEKIKEMNANAVKLLIYYNPKEKSARYQEKIVEKVSKECEKNNILFLCEFSLYSIEGNRNNVLVESAEKISNLGIDILKTEAPTTLEKCKELDKKIEVPWVVLSGGIDYEKFKKRLKIACKAGASGFAGGRGIWKDCLGENLENCLKEKSIPRLKELRKIVEKYGKSAIK